MTILIVIIALSLLVFVHELGHFLAAKYMGMKVNEFGIGFPPRVLSKKVGETTYSLNALPFGGFVRIFGEDPDEADIDSLDRERSFSHQPAWRRTVVILAGVFMNILFGWILLSFVFMSGIPERLIVSDVLPDSPAAQAELRMGDTIVGAEVAGTSLEDVNADSFVSFVRDNPGETFLLSVQRGNEVISIEVAGREISEEGIIGINVVDSGVESRSFFPALWDSLSVTIGTLIAITIAFFSLIIGIFTTPEVVESLAGPVGIFVLAQDATAMGVVYLSQLTAIISLNLAILNLIPFPALDGGRFVMIIAEKIKGSPISRNVQVGINAFGFIILLVLMVLITIQDVGRFFS